MTESDFLMAFNQPWTQESPSNHLFKNANRPAAVLVCLFKHLDRLHVLFTQRADHLKHHAGQISFPGGKAEDSDNSLVETAYREAREEVGLKSEHLRLIGKLGEYKTISGFAVYPIIAIYEHPLDISKDLIIDDNEVADVFHVPLEFLMDESNYFSETIRRNNYSFPVYFVPFEGKMIWGATAGILAQLQQHVESVHGKP